MRIDWQAFLSTIWGAAQASISVLLVLAYGYASRAYELLTQQGEENISKLSMTLCLPALLFSEMGPEASASKLIEYWPIIVFSLITQLFSLAYAYLGRLLFGHALPTWMVPACIFNNVISLPLLMLQSLGSTGALDGITLGDHSTDGALRRAKNYLLINALVYNLTRFTFGPMLMSPSKTDTNSSSGSAPQSPVDSGSSYEENSEGERTPLLSRSPGQAPSRIRLILRKIRDALNPPIVGGLLAIFCGIIPPLHTAFFSKTGALNGSLTQSIDKIGNIYTALQILVVGAHLCSSSRRFTKTKLPKLALVYLFALRFILMPAFSISFIYAIRNWLPNLFLRDPILDFVLMISSVGPPALSLAAIAEIAKLSDKEKGAVARVLTLSYMVTPFVSIPIAVALTVVTQEGITYER